MFKNDLISEIHFW